MITFSSSYGSVELRNPILGDSEQLDLHTIFHICMDKSIYSTRRTPTHSKLLLNFVHITRTKYLEFLNWYINSRGMSINYTDYNSVAWVGTISNNPLEVTPVGKLPATPCTGGKEVVTLTIEFDAETS